MDEKGTAVSSRINRSYLRVDEVASYFGVSGKTIYRLIDLGELKAVRVGICVRISTEEIKEFEMNHRGDF